MSSDSSLNNAQPKGRKKTSRDPAPCTPSRSPKPPWIRARLPSSPKVMKLKSVLRENRLYTVCEEALCPNIGECFAHGTATFMIMGHLCTRRCSFCDVAQGRPDPLDEAEPLRLAETVAQMNLRYVVITSVDRDDLKDGGAKHFIACIQAVRHRNPGIRVEVLVPDFRRCMDLALDVFSMSPPDVFNHNIETVPRLYKKVRAGADYAHSLQLLAAYKQRYPEVLTKSGFMLGLGENDDEVVQIMRDLRQHQCDMLTIGQYLQPSRHHEPVDRYVPPEGFQHLGEQARAMGFAQVASGPMVRSSYHADLQTGAILNQGTSA